MSKRHGDSLESTSTSAKVARVDDEEDVEEEEPMEHDGIDFASRKRACNHSVRVERREPPNLRRGMSAYINMLEALKMPVRNAQMMSRQMKVIIFAPRVKQGDVWVGDKVYPRESVLMASTILEKMFILEIGEVMSARVNHKVVITTKILGSLCYVLAKTKAPRMIYKDIMQAQEILTANLPVGHVALSIMSSIVEQMEWSNGAGLTVYHDSVSTHRLKRIPIMPQFHKSEFIYDDLFERQTSNESLDVIIFLIYLKEFMEKNGISEALF